MCAFKSRKTRWREQTAPRRGYLSFCPSFLCDGSTYSWSDMIQPVAALTRWVSACIGSVNKHFLSCRTSNRAGHPRAAKGEVGKYYKCCVKDVRINIWLVVEATAWRSYFHNLLFHSLRHITTSYKLHSSLCTSFHRDNVPKMYSVAANDPYTTDFISKAPR